jgi:hypothetical protein
MLFLSLSLLLAVSDCNRTIFEEEAGSLSKQVLRSVIDMVICEGRHGVIAVVVVRLEPNIDALLLPYFLCCGGEVLG